jgi:hypothetical protein
MESLGSVPEDGVALGLRVRRSSMYLYLPLESIYMLGKEGHVQWVGNEYYYDIIAASK